MKKIISIATLLFTNLILFAQSACPQVTISPVSPICAGNCVNLTATVQGSVATTSYTISTTPYTPYSFTGGTPVLVNIDDTWSPVVNMPFCFQFFGNTYNQFIIGSNGLISFDVVTYTPSSYCQWPISNSIPSNLNPLNSIMAPYEDIDPGIGTPTSATDINWAVYGTAPCRYMVINYNDVAMFSCTSLITTSQIVLHETTNIIDIYIKDKPTCSAWNSGASIEGIQNSTGTVAFVVPGRNYPTIWSAFNDGQRFTPSGAPQYTIDWSGPSGSLGNSNPITVCPMTTTTYTCTVTNITCAGNVVVSDTVTVVVTSGLVLSGTQTNSTCNLACDGTATVNTGPGNFTYSWSTSPIQTTQTASGLCSGNYTCTVTSSSGCIDTLTFTITEPGPLSVTYTTTPLSGCEPLTVTFTNTSPNSSSCVWMIGSTPITGCVTTYTFNTGSYNITLTTTDANGCSVTSPTIIVNVYPMPIASFTANPNITDINNNTISFTNMSNFGVYNWDFGDTNTSTLTNPTNTYTDTGTYTIQLIVVTTDGCSDTSYGTVYIKEVYSFFIPNAFTPNSNGLNDFFFPSIEGYKSYTMLIFDRWGLELYHGTQNDKWDGTYNGKVVQEDVYVWKIDAIDLNNKHHQYIGRVSVIK